MCPCPVSWLEWKIVVWIVWLFQFYLWVLKGCAIPNDDFIYPPISVVKETWANCSVIILLGRLSQAERSVVLVDFWGKFWGMEYMQFYVFQFSFFTRNLFHFIACGLFNFFARVFLNNLINLISVVRILLTIFLTQIFFSCGITLALLTVIFTTSSKFTVLCYGYAARLSDSLWKISISFRKSRFMARISFISDFYISTISFVLLMVVSFDENLCSYIE